MANPNGQQNHRNNIENPITVYLKIEINQQNVLFLAEFRTYDRINDRKSDGFHSHGKRSFHHNTERKLLERVRRNGQHRQVGNNQWVQN